MKFAELLCYADINQLAKIAAHYQCVCNQRSKNELTQAILTAITRHETFEQQMAAMSLEEVRFLNSLLFDSQNVFSHEELLARAQQTQFNKKESSSVVNPRDMVIKFKHIGWLFPGYSQQTRYLLQLPHDIRERVRAILAETFLQKVEHAAEPPAVRDEQTLILDDIQYFLNFLFHNEVSINGEGVMYKRDLAQILKNFSVYEEMVAKSAWRFGYGKCFKHYPSRFSLIYDFVAHQGWIEERDQKLLLTSEGTKRVKEKCKVDFLQLLKFWIKLYKTAIPNVMAMSYWIDICSRSWVSIDSLGQVLHPMIKPFYYDDEKSILEQRILRMMMHLGLLKIGEDEIMGTMVQMTPLGSMYIAKLSKGYESK